MTNSAYRVAKAKGGIDSFVELYFFTFWDQFTLREFNSKKQHPPMSDDLGSNESWDSDQQPDLNFNVQ
jgi:hypothetical protein